jgi:hypothetical protein
MVLVTTKTTSAFEGKTIIKYFVSI